MLCELLVEYNVLHTGNSTRQNGLAYQASQVLHQHLYFRSGITSGNGLRCTDLYSIQCHPCCPLCSIQYYCSTVFWVRFLSVCFFGSLMQECSRCFGDCIHVCKLSLDKLDLQMHLVSQMESTADKPMVSHLNSARI